MNLGSGADFIKGLRLRHWLKSEVLVSSQFWAKILFTKLVGVKFFNHKLHKFCQFSLLSTHILRNIRGF